MIIVVRLYGAIAVCRWPAPIVLRPGRIALLRVATIQAVTTGIVVAAEFPAKNRCHVTAVFFYQILFEITPRMRMSFPNRR